MPRILIVSKVEDTRKWEESIPIRQDMFRLMTVSRMSYATTEEELALVMDVDNVAVFFEYLQSQEIQENIAVDGFRAETTRIYVLDKEFEL